MSFNLIRELVVRDLSARYRGSVFGIFWIVAQPLMLLSIYSFVFGSVFKAKQDVLGVQSSHSDFAIFLYTGLIFLQVMSEVLTRSPVAITSNPNFVKKVIFPIYALPLVIVISSLINSLINVTVLLAVSLFVYGLPGFKLATLFLLLPLLVPMLLGTALIFSSVGVFIRDLSQMSGLLATVLTFASPIFYRMDQVPERFRGILSLNPVATLVEIARNYMYGGSAPSLVSIFGAILISLVSLLLGILLFNKLKVHFADVI